MPESSARPSLAPVAVAYRFGRFLLEPRERRLSRDGVEVALTAKQLDTLATLVKAAGRLVTRDELIAAVWPDTVVEEGNLTWAISHLRRVLGDDLGEAIATVRGHGYRFLWPVEPLLVREEPEENSGVVPASLPAPRPVPETSPGLRSGPRAGRRWLAVAASAAALLALAIAVWLVRRPSVLSQEPGGLAVLDPVALTPEAASEAWLGTALAELVRAELAADGALRVVHGEDVERMRRDLALPAREAFDAAETVRIGRHLGAAWVASGSLLVAPGGDELRVVVRLQRAVDGATLVTVRRGGPKAELFALADGVAAELRALLAPSAAAPASTSLASLLPADALARQSFAEALAHLRRLEAKRATELLAIVTERAPDFALGWYELSRAYRGAGYEDRAVEAARRAFAHAGTLPDSIRRSVEARCLLLTGEVDRAVELLAAVAAERPGDPQAVLDLVQAQLDAARPRDALAAIERLMAAEPAVAIDPRLALHAALAAERAGELAAALAQAERAERLAVGRGSPSLEAEALMRQGAVRMLQGPAQGLAAVPLLERGLSLVRGGGEPMVELRLQWVLGNALHIAGRADPRRYAAAQQAWEDALARARALGARSSERSLLSNLANLAFNRGDVSAMARGLEECLAICAELRSRPCRIKVAEAAVQAFELSGWLTRAEELATEGLAAVDDQSASAEASFAVNLGSLAVRAGRPVEAEARYRRALELWAQIGQEQSRRWVEVDLTEALLAQGRGDEMAERLEAIATAPETDSDPYLEAYARTFLVRLALGRGDLAAAARESERAVQLAPAPAYPTVSFPAAIGRAAVLDASGDAAAAAALLEATRALAAEKGARLAELEAAIELARLGGATELLGRLEHEARDIGAMALAARAGGSLAARRSGAVAHRSPSTSNR